MTMTDPIADMLTRIQKCQYCRSSETVEIPASKNEKIHRQKF